MEDSVVEKVSLKTEIPVADVKAALEAFGVTVKEDLRDKGKSCLLNLLEVKAVQRPKTAPRLGILPFTGEEIMFRTKPARIRIKTSATKHLDKFLKDASG